MSSKTSEILIQFKNCRILHKSAIIREDLWVRNGKIVNPQTIFFEEKIPADIQIDCDNFLIIPGFIDVQLNGGFGYDFSSDTEKCAEGLNAVAKGILEHGVTSFCPTLVTSPADVYRQVLPDFKKKPGGKHGAQVLGVHCEGPFISAEKKGAHDKNHIYTKNVSSIDTIYSMYGSLENVAIITVAPEIPGILDCIPELVKKNIVVSIGHSTSNLALAEEAVNKGALFITHLFNAMLPFHHRDPGIVGVLTSIKTTPNNVFYGVISDGIHTHPTALRIAQRSHPNGIILITDAIAALGLSPGIHKLGTMTLEITEKTAKIHGTDTLAGSICSMEQCVRHFRKETGATLVEAIEAATLHPAQLLGITEQKGTLDYGTDADFVFLDEDNMVVHATFIDGEPVYIKADSPLLKLQNYYGN